MNVITFAEYCLQKLSSASYLSVFLHPLNTDVDRQAFETLVSLGVPPFHAHFVCNYFLACNLEYPGELIILSSQTPDFTPIILLPQDPRGLEIVEFWERAPHEIIREPTPCYFADMDTSLDDEDPEID